MFVAATLINAVFAAASGTMAKQWATSGNNLWLVAAVVSNMIAFLALAWAIRGQGLGMATAVILLVSIAANAIIGVTMFREALTLQQFAGIGLAAVAIVLMTMPRSLI